MKEKELYATIIKRLEKEPDNFSWIPSFSSDPLNKDQLIKEINKNSKIGKRFVNMIINGTISRYKKEILKKSEVMKDDFRDLPI